uniref:Uncharacterized protein n=1 Tax=Rhizophora mucronata TaxID=61149 RepID=A0A2P2PJY0_RHIMU
MFQFRGKSSRCLVISALKKR